MLIDIYFVLLLFPFWDAKIIKVCEEKKF